MERSRLTGTENVSQENSKVKSMLVLSFHIIGTVPIKFVPAAHAVNYAYYCDFNGDCVKTCGNGIT
jgi:hypothetical protein